MRVGVLALAALAIGATPAQAKTCKAFRYSDGYITALAVKRVSCGTGGKVARAHYDCRNEHGKRGHCTHKVRRYRCAEGKRFGNGNEINAKVTCKRGRRRVVFFYSQDL